MLWPVAALGGRSVGRAAMWSTRKALAMRGSLTAILIPLVASLCIVAAVAWAGGGLDNVAVSAVSPSEVTDMACLKAPLASVGGGMVGGRARLCLSDGSVRTVIQLEQLADKVTYVAWLAYFDRPARCLSRPCAGPDLVGERPVGVRGRVDAAVPDVTRRGSIAVTHHGLRLRGGSEVQLLIFERGQLDRLDIDQRARLLLEWPASLGERSGPGVGGWSEGGSLAARAVVIVPGDADALDGTH